MFGDLLGDMQAKQAEMQKSLSQIEVKVEMEGIVLIGNAARQITNVIVDESLLKADNKDQLEDLLVTCFNRLSEQMSQKEAEESEKLMADFLPPGMEHLLGGLK